jgi:hypothetical protein
VSGRFGAGCSAPSSKQFAAIGVEGLMADFQPGPAADAEVRESIRLFVKQVIPHGGA